MVHFVDKRAKLSRELAVAVKRHLDGFCGRFIERNRAFYFLYRIVSASGQTSYVYL